MEKNFAEMEEHAVRTMDLRQTDPSFTTLFERFVREDVEQQSSLDRRTRCMAVLASLMGCQGTDTFQAVLPAALQAGVTPVEIKEIIYQ